MLTMRNTKPEIMAALDNADIPYSKKATKVGLLALLQGV
jgi:hypothetical protein